MKVHRIDPPASDVEIELRRALYELRREYETRAQPLIDALVRVKSTEIPRYYLELEPGEVLPPHLV